MIERRQAPDRRVQDRRHPSECVDVTRLEHENLYGQVEEILRRLRRLETDLHNVGDRLRIVERDLAAVVSPQGKAV